MMCTNKTEKLSAESPGASNRQAERMGRAPSSTGGRHPHSCRGVHALPAPLPASSCPQRLVSTAPVFHTGSSRCVRDSPPPGFTRLPTLSFFPPPTRVQYLQSPAGGPHGGGVRNPGQGICRVRGEIFLDASCYAHGECRPTSEPCSSHRALNAWHRRFKMPTPIPREPQV